ncbi:MAG: hypothetical protein ACRDLP_09565, partial [Solirubrobacteraceae bacterium]
MSNVSRRRETNETATDAPESPGAGIRASNADGFDVSDVVISAVAWTPRTPITNRRWADYG